MTIRPYRDADRATLKAMTSEAFDGVSIDQNIEGKFGPIAGRDWRWRKARHIDADADASGSAIWVAEENGSIVGFITTRTDREAGVGSISNLVVREAERGQGIGRRLVEHAVEQFRASGLALARIETLDQNGAGQHLFPSCGFVEVARLIHFAMPLDDKGAGSSRRATVEEPR